MNDGRQRPVGRRVGCRVDRPRRLGEEDVVLQPVHVVRRRDNRAAICQRARIPDLERVERLDLELGVADDVHRKQVLTWKGRVDEAQIDRLRDDQVDEVVDHRWRTIGLVVGDAERLILIRLDQHGDARGEHEVVDEIEPIDARAGDQTEMVAQEDLVLPVDTKLGAVVGVRRDRQIVAVESKISAVVHHVFAKRMHVRQVEIDGRRVELERDRRTVEAERQQLVGVAAEDVGVERCAQGLPAEAGLRVAHHRTAVDVERTDTGVHDAVGAGDAARE